MSQKEKNIIGRRLVRSYFSSVVSISLVLVLVGVVAIFAVNAKQISDFFKENMTVSLILKATVTEDEALAMVKRLDSASYVKSATYISKEEGAKEMQTLLGEDFLNVFESNPVPISIDLQLNGNSVTKDSLDVLKKQLMKDEKIKEVVYQESLVEALNANLTKIGVALAVIIIVLMFISFVLISNTIRLSVYSRRFTIHTMQLVGAKKSFIRRPFVRQSMWQGLVSGVIAGVLIMGIIYAVSRDSELFTSLFDMKLVWAVLVGVIVLGMVICMISSFFVVNRLVNISNDDLYC
ncbi:MAG: permease-like cell division protein FtsX [Bacteroidales bacterium]|nr:permease-like cell division protein FtsX [Bacteroidales bacterium]MDD3200854.1 permease-like cell division protein FtsX [Bacteroidales bacterium]